MDSVCDMVREVRSLGMEACVTLGMLSPAQVNRLQRRRARLLQPQSRHLGREFYPEIITTRT